MGTYFYKGSTDIFKKDIKIEESSDSEANLKKIQDSFLKVLDNKNLSLPVVHLGNINF